MVEVSPAKYLNYLHVNLGSLKIFLVDLLCTIPTKLTDCASQQMLKILPQKQVDPTSFIRI